MTPSLVPKAIRLSSDTLRASNIVKSDSLSFRCGPQQFLPFSGTFTVTQGHFSFPCSCISRSQITHVSWDAADLHRLLRNDASYNTLIELRVAASVSRFHPNFVAHRVLVCHTISWRLLTRRSSLAPPGDLVPVEHASWRGVGRLVISGRHVVQVDGFGYGAVGPGCDDLHTSVTALSYSVPGGHIRAAKPQAYTPALHEVAKRAAAERRIIIQE